jgi:YjbE family integral membrane protein
MGFDGVMHALGMMLQVFLLDLVLSGDNAVVIALACRSLPPRQMRQAILIGTGAAIFLRVLLTTVITFLLAIPSLRLIGGLALIYIALKLMLEEEDAAEGAPGAASDKLWSTVWIVVVADLVMSLDNVVALAAAVHGSIFFLVAGLLLSVPLLMFGSMFVSGLLNRFPLLVPAVGALRGWIAGDIGVSDPLVADWVNSQSPALIVAMPMLCAAYVLLQSKILKERRARTGAVSGAARKAPLSMRILSMNAAAAAIAQPDSGPAREASAAPAEIMPPRPAAAPPRTPLRPRRDTDDGSRRSAADIAVFQLFRQKPDAGAGAFAGLRLPRFSRRVLPVLPSRDGAGATAFGRACRGRRDACRPDRMGRRRGRGAGVCAAR